METSQTENDELRRLEKEQNVLTLKPSTLCPETKPCNTETSYLVTKSSPVTADHCADGISNDVPPSSGKETRVSIVKLAAISSKDHPIICCLAAKQKQTVSTTVNNHTSESQSSQYDGDTPCDSSQETNLADTMQHAPKYEQSDRAPVAGDQSSTITESDNEPSENVSTLSTIHHQCEKSQTDNRTSQFQTINTTQRSAFKSVSMPDTTANCGLEKDSIQNRFENGLTNSSFTPRKLPFQDHSYANTTLKQSPVKSSYLDTGSWDPLCHHMSDHEKNIALPHDLRYLKETELLPMAYADLTKSLEEELCCSPTEMLTLVDDGVVPSSPLLPRDDARSYTICCDTSSTDGSQEYSWESFSARNENIYKSPSLSYNYPQYGTLNWGLRPTIIYKTPDPKASLQDVGDDYMKCSISEGNVELLTPPPPNYKKLLSRSRRRMKKRDVKRRRIYFGNDEDYQGLQEVPVSESEKDSEKSLDTDFVPDDPMWFEDDDENVLPDSEDKPFSLSEEDIVDYCEYHGNLSPNSEETIATYQILTEAVEYIKKEEETLDDFNAGCEENAEVITEESDKCDKLTTIDCEDVSEIVPQWSKIDETSYEIQEILDSLDLPEGASLDGCEEAASTDLSFVKETPSKRKRKYQKSSNRKRKMPRKQKKSSEHNTRSNKPDQCLPDDNSSSQRSDCESVHLYEKSKRSNSSRRCNSQGSRCITPIMPKPTPGVLVSPSVMGFVPFETTGKPLILPKPPSQEGCFSSSTSPLRSPFSSPQLISTMTQTHSTWLGSGQVIKEPAKKCRGKASGKERPIKGKGRGRRKGPQKKTIPNGYMLFCKDKRNRIFKSNPDLKSKPGDITKLLSESWNKLSEEKRRPYAEEAKKLRCDESKWIGQSP